MLHKTIVTVSEYVGKTETMDKIIPIYNILVQVNFLRPRLISLDLQP